MLGEQNTFQIAILGTILKPLEHAMLLFAVYLPASLREIRHIRTMQASTLIVVSTGMDPA